MNKLIVVTGGTKGIGRAVLELFAKNQFDVVTCSRHVTDLERIKEEAEELLPEVKIFTKEADLSRREDVDAFVSFIQELNRPVDILVNNSGMFLPGTITEEEEGNLERMMNLNLFSAYHITRGLVPAMKEMGSGYIFNLCSIANLGPYPNGGSYSITKYALHGFSVNLRNELKDTGIRVSSIMPGATFTSSWEGVGIPQELFIKADDIAKTILGAYQLSDSAVVEEIVIRPQQGDI